MKAEAEYKVETETMKYCRSLKRKGIFVVDPVAAVKAIEKKNSNFFKELEIEDPEAIVRLILKRNFSMGLNRTEFVIKEISSVYSYEELKELFLNFFGEDPHAAGGDLAHNWDGTKSAILINGCLEFKEVVRSEITTPLGNGKVNKRTVVEFDDFHNVEKVSEVYTVYREIKLSSTIQDLLEEKR